MKSNNIQRGVLSLAPEFDPPSSANLLRKAARAAKERQKRWISRLFIPVAGVQWNDVQAVALSNFDGGGPEADLVSEEGAEMD